jgi:hypothetical protein
MATTRPKKLTAKPKAPSAKAKALHRKALRHNWDDGLFQLEQILADRSCDLGTALAIYWMGAPGFDQAYTTSKDLGGDGWRRPVFSFLRKLEKRILKRDFATASILFNPRFDRQTVSRTGHDWTAEYADVKKVRPIPDALKEPSCPDPAWEKRRRTPIANTANRLT